MGQTQCSSASPPSPEDSRFPPRACLRKGCGRIFNARSANQRYCQDPECLRLVSRWQAAKRQRVRRLRPEVRGERAAAAREARERKPRLKTDPPPLTERVMPAEQPDPPDAWSRSRKNPGPICDRVGCYESPRPSCRCPARYCSHECRHAMQQVRDRERKWLWRNTFAGQFKRRLEAQKRQAARRVASADHIFANADDAITSGSDAVLPYWSLPDVSVVSGDRKEDISHEVHDLQTPVAARSRPPPAS